MNTPGAQYWKSRCCVHSWPGPRFSVVVPVSHEPALVGHEAAKMKLPVPAWPLLRTRTVLPTEQGRGQLSTETAMSGRGTTHEPDEHVRPLEHDPAQQFWPEPPQAWQVEPSQIDPEPQLSHWIVPPQPLLREPHEPAPHTWAFVL